MKATLRAGLAAAFVIPLLVLTGCGDRASGGAGAGDGDPMAALESSTTSAEYNEAFWGDQRRADSELWQWATAYCDGRDGNEYPNCRPVLSLLLLDRTLDRSRTASPGFDGGMEMTDRADSAQDRLDSLVAPR